MGLAPSPVSRTVRSRGLLPCRPLTASGPHHRDNCGEGPTSFRPLHVRPKTPADRLTGKGSVTPPQTPPHRTAAQRLRDPEAPEAARLRGRATSARGPRASPRVGPPRARVTAGPGEPQGAPQPSMQVSSPCSGVPAGPGLGLEGASVAPPRTVSGEDVTVPETGSGRGRRRRVAGGAPRAPVIPHRPALPVVGAPRGRALDRDAASAPAGSASEETPRVVDATRPLMREEIEEREATRADPKPFPNGPSGNPPVPDATPERRGKGTKSLGARG